MEVQCGIVVFVCVCVCLCLCLCLWGCEACGAALQVLVRRGWATWHGSEGIFFVCFYGVKLGVARYV